MARRRVRVAGSVNDALRKLGLADAKVTVRSVDCIQRLNSGKLERFIPLS